MMLVAMGSQSWAGRRTYSLRVLRNVGGLW